MSERSEFRQALLQNLIKQIPEENLHGERVREVSPNRRLIVEEKPSGQLTVHRYSDFRIFDPSVNLGPGLAGATGAERVTIEAGIYGCVPIIGWGMFAWNVGRKLWENRPVSTMELAIIERQLNERKESK